MTVKILRIRNKQTNWTLDWPVDDWNLHDDLYKADWEVLSDEPLVIGTYNGKVRVEQPEAPAPAADPVDAPADAETAPEADEAPAAKATSKK